MRARPRNSYHHIKCSIIHVYSLTIYYNNKKLFATDTERTKMSVACFFYIGSIHILFYKSKSVTNTSFYYINQSTDNPASVCILLIYVYYISASVYFPCNDVCKPLH